MSAPRPYAFTDPLDASDAAGTRRRIRHAHGLVYIAGAVSLLLALLEVDGPLAQHVVVGSAAAISATVALLALTWRQVPDALLVGAFPVAALVVTAIAVLDPPLALTPMFYVWPLMSAASFLRPRELLVTYGVVVASFAAAIPWIEPRPTPIQWITVAIVGGVVVVFVRRLTGALDRQAQRLGALAREDPLTGALNRRALLERLEQELVRGRRSGHWPAVVVLDVDLFKDINDRFGHATGDEACACWCGRPPHGCAPGTPSDGSEARSSPSSSRARTQPAPRPARRTCGCSAAAVATGTPFTVSVGVAAPEHGGEDADALLAAADAALYRAKRAGRDMVCVASRAVRRRPRAGRSARHRAAAGAPSTAPAPCRPAPTAWR